MSRRKKRSPKRNLAAPAEPAPRQPHPPRPNKWFLLGSIGLLAVWMAFLVAMAVTS